MGTSERIHNGTEEFHQISYKAANTKYRSHSLAQLEQLEASARTAIPKPLKLLPMLTVALNSPTAAFAPPHQRLVTGRNHKASMSHPNGVHTGLLSAISMEKNDDIVDI